MTNSAAVFNPNHTGSNTPAMLSPMTSTMSLPVKQWLLMIAAGLIFGAMGIRAWLMAGGLWEAPAAWKPWMLLDAPVLFGLVAVLVHHRYRVQMTTAQHAPAIALWNAVGAAIAAMAMAFGVVAWKTHSVNVMGLFTPMLFVIYGMAWWVASHGRQWSVLKWVAIGNFVTATATALLIGKPELWLAEAMGLLLFGSVPGVVALRAANPTPTVGSYPAAK